MDAQKIEGKGLLANTLRVAWPAVMESFFIAIAGVIDTIMVSTLGEYAVAAIGLTNQPKFLLMTVFIGMSISVSALIARRKGQNDKHSAHETLLTALVVAVILCVGISLAAVIFAEPIVRLVGSNADTHAAATVYFRIIMGAMIFNILSMIINAAQRGSGNTKIALTTNLVSTCVNIFCNYLLIGGKFGFPRLEVAGAAIATVLGTVAACIMSFASLFRKASFVQLSYIVSYKVRVTLVSVKSIFNLAVSIILENIAMRVGFMTTAVSAAKLGTIPFATHNVGMNILSLGFAFADGMQVSAVALTGESLGRGEKELAKQYGQVCQRVGLVISIALALFLLIFGKGIFKLHFDNPAIWAEGKMVSRFIMVIVLAQISQIIFGGCLRAAGDVKYTLLVSIISVTIIRTAVTIILVNYLHFGLAGIWLGILSDQASRLIFMSTRYKRGKWVDIKI